MKKSKRQSRGQDSVSGLDRISGLPDALLCHILSFLQTIYAVRTSVLSTRWKNIWESVPNLDFDRGPFRAPTKLKTFADHVLFLRNASNIQKFRLYWKYNEYCLGQAKSLVTASIELIDDYCSNKDPDFSRATARVAGVSNVKFLCLSAHCFEVGSLPAFGNLSKLKLVLHKCFPWELLTELLNRSPHLEHLVLEHNATSCNEKVSKHEGDSKHEAAPKPRWHPPELVPISLVSHLETVSIKGFKGQLDAMEVAKYFLRNGEVLKKMTISSAPLCKGKQALVKELLVVPKVSKACIVDFV